jgi:hypothetical protein
MAIQSYDLESERQSRNPFQAGLNKLLAQALAEKSLVWFSAVGSLGLWTFAIMHPEPLRLVAAAGYSILSYIPLAWRK